MPRAERLVRDFNAIFKENDKIYRDAARRLGLSDTVFWILYMIREAEGPVFQRDIIGLSFLPPQTVNSALKKLQSDGFAELRGNTSDRRCKQIALTEKGESLAQRTVDRAIAAEGRAMAEFADADIFLRLFERYNGLLKDAFAKMEGGSGSEQL